MKILQIASGSSGNATYIESDSTKILIDCGLSKKVIVEALTKYNHNLAEIDAILITHEHTDHVKGLIPVSNVCTCPIYLSSGTYSNLNKQTKEKLDKDRIVKIIADQTYEFKDIEIFTIAISHDAKEPLGFLILNKDLKVVYITDTGFVAKDYFAKLRNANLYIFESNYDPIMLMTSDRDYNTKLRINSDNGHMSNELSALTMTTLIGEKTKTIMLAHMSKECNDPNIALKTYHKVFSDEGKSLDNIDLICLKDSMTEEIEI